MTDNPVRIGIAGASGRMGRKLIEVVCNKSMYPRATLTAALVRPNHQFIGVPATVFGTTTTVLTNWKNADAVCFSDQFNPADVDVLIDFSVPDATLALSQQCRKNNIAMVVGVTGFSDKEKKELSAVSSDIPLLVAPNMSIGVRMMFNISEHAASILAKFYDIEICESHHRYKADAPSGTALHLGEIIAKKRGNNLEDVAVYSRDRKGNQRRPNEIGFSAIRGGDIVGEHRVIFAGNGEQIEIIHRSTDRIHYAMGAVRAALFLAGQKAGLYSMQDINS